MVWVASLNREVAQAEVGAVRTGAVFGVGLVLWGQHAHMQLIWQKCLRRAAMHACQALEENEVSADITVKDLHEQIVVESSPRLIQ